MPIEALASYSDGSSTSTVPVSVGRRSWVAASTGVTPGNVVVFRLARRWSIAIATGVVGLFNYIRSNRLPDLFTTNGG